MSDTDSLSSGSSSGDDDIYICGANKFEALKRRRKVGQPSRKKVCKEKSSEEVRNEPIVVDEEPREELSSGPVQETVILNKQPLVIDSTSSDSNDVVMTAIEEPVMENRQRSLRNLRSNSKMNDMNVSYKSLEDESFMRDDSYSEFSDSPGDAILIGSPEHNKINVDDFVVCVKIRWKSKTIERFDLRMLEPFEKVFKHFARTENVKEDQILITKNEKVVNKFDTPSAIKWSIVDILEGGIVCSKSESQADSKKQNVCKIRIQTSAGKSIEVNVQKNQDFSVLWSECAKQLSEPESKIKLSFDGEAVEKDDTPDSLDLEDEACFDLKILK